MAHSCPECDQMCHCGGDIDDCILDGDSAQDKCTHWKECEAGVDEDDDGYFPCDVDEDDFEEDEPKIDPVTNAEAAKKMIDLFNQES